MHSTTVRLLGNNSICFRFVKQWSSNLLNSKVNHIDFATFASKPYKRPPRGNSESQNKIDDNNEQEKIINESQNSTKENSSDPWGSLLSEKKQTKSQEGKYFPPGKKFRTNASFSKSNVEQTTQNQSELEQEVQRVVNQDEEKDENYLNQLEDLLEDKPKSQFAKKDSDYDPDASFNQKEEKKILKKKGLTEIPPQVEYRSDPSGETSMFIKNIRVPEHLQHFVLDPFGEKDHRDKIHERKVRNLQRIHTKANMPPLLSTTPRTLEDRFTRRQKRVAEYYLKNFVELVNEMSAFKSDLKIFIQARFEPTEIEVTRDMKRATVFWTVGDESRKEEVATELKRAAVKRLLRHELAKKTSRMKYVPELKFVHEKEKNKKSEEMDLIFDRLEKEYLEGESLQNAPSKEDIEKAINPVQ